MKRYIVYLIALLCVFALQAQTVQDRPNHAAKAGFFEPAFCPQWVDTTAAAPTLTDTLFFVGGDSTIHSALFRNWPMLSGVMEVVEDDSLVLSALQVWTVPINDTSKAVYSKTLLFSPQAGGTADSTISATGKYAVDFADGGEWHPMLYVQLRAVPGTDNKVLAGNKLVLRLQGYSEK
jgi:hypothetical protein